MRLIVPIVERHRSIVESRYLLNLGLAFAGLALLVFEIRDVVIIVVVFASSSAKVSHVGQTTASLKL